MGNRNRHVIGGLWVLLCTDCADCGPRERTTRPTAGEFATVICHYDRMCGEFAVPTTSPTFLTIQSAAPRVKVTVTFKGLVKEDVIKDAKSQAALRQVGANYKQLRNSV